MRRYRFRVWLRSALWFVPVACVCAAVLLAAGLLALDRRHPGMVSTSITGNSTTASTILSTIAASMVTLTTLVLTITTVAVQLSMGQFSPRIVRALLEDRRSQFTYGIFGATFAFAVLAMIGLDEPSGFVPGVTVLTAYGLTFASVGALFLYMHHSGQRLGPAGLIDFVGSHLITEIDRYPAIATGSRAEEPGEEDELVLAQRGGVVDVVDVDRLLKVATAQGCRIAVVPRLGDFVPAGAPLARVHSGDQEVRRDVHKEVHRCVVLTSSRSHTHDPAFGIRKLVDIAERSLASGPFTDPTTAVQAVDRLHDALRQLAPRRLPPTEHRDARGEVRVVTPQLDWAGFVRLGFDEIRLAGTASPQVARRLQAALEDLMSVAPPDRQKPIQRQLELLRLGVQEAYDRDEDVTATSVPDAQGIGSGSDVIRPTRVKAMYEAAEAAPRDGQ